MNNVRSIAALVAVVSMLLLVGCATTSIAPLGEPTAETISFDTTTTLDYKMPTVDVYSCPVHGRVVQTVTIRGKEYCSHCLWEKLLDD
jgi:hypothetical protein